MTEPIVQSVLVTGASGLLGRQVVKAFDEAGWTVTGTALTRADGVKLRKVDLESTLAVQAVLTEVRPDVVVHSNRFPDKVDANPEGTRRLNIDASRTLASLSAGSGVRLLVYISTDYVFSGRPGEAPYEGDATPNPPNLYGQSKLDGEQVVLSAFAEAQVAGKTTGRAVVLRVPVLYGKAVRPAESAVNTLLDTVRRVQEENVTVMMDDWSIRYPTNTEDVARVLRDIACTYLDKAGDLPTVLQFTSEDCTTKYGICQRFAAILGVGLDRLTPDKTGGGGATAKGSVQRPYDCHLSTQALQTLGIAVYTQDFEAWWRRELYAFRH